MTKSTIVFITTTLVAVTTAPLHSQIPGTRSAVIGETYSFGAGLPFTNVHEFSLPVTVTTSFGRIGTLTVSGGAAAVIVEREATETQNIVGLLDTELRFGINVIPDRLILLATGTVPTGMGTIEQAHLAVLPAVASDLIGFASSDLGSGGSIGSGLVAALPTGPMAVGIAATFQRPFQYEPVQGQPETLRPGSEFRVRAGIEGPLAQRTYFRVAGIVAARGKDRIDGANVNGVGNRLTGYVSLDQGLSGAASLGVYAFGVRRSDPTIEQTALGAAVLPRGTLIALGTQLAAQLSPLVQLVPRAEYRVSHAAPDTSTTSQLEKLGNVLRFGLDVRFNPGGRTVVVLQGSRLSGDLRQTGGSTPFSSVSGYRAAIHLEVRP